MHLSFLTRGVNHEIELFKIFMQAQMFPWKRINLKTGKDEITAVQGSLRPIQLWEYIFPEECLGEVLAMLGLTNPKDYMTTPSLSKAKRWALMKMLQSKPLPAMPDQPITRFISRAGVAIYPIGIKKDPRKDYPNFGYNQEGL